MIMFLKAKLQSTAHISFILLRPYPYLLKIKFFIKAKQIHGSMGR